MYEKVMTALRGCTYSQNSIADEKGENSEK